ncbi:hypothetical protein [Micrococcus luteus]|uniref:hypothetical protein n=1 Tax=Micrococcus luteus TaxID=1270 RepID=UPI0036266607
MQLTLTADSLARALDVAAAPYRNCPTRPGKHDPASTLVLEATTEGLMCTGSSEQLTAFTLADYLHTAPAALPHLTPAQMPAAAAHRVRQALADAADGWATVNTTAALIYFDAHGFDAPVEIPNVWGTLPARDLDADRPTPGPPTPGAQLTALTPGALAALTTALARHAHPYSRHGLQITPDLDGPEPLLRWSFQDWAGGTLTPCPGPAPAAHPERLHRAAAYRAAPVLMPA